MKYYFPKHYTSLPIFFSSQGNLKSDEHVTEGFENMFDAFHGLFNGKNIGKSLVKV